MTGRREPSRGPFKLLAIDIDGTLVDGTLEITPANLAALQGAIGRGTRVVLATGRMFRSALRYAEEIGTNEPVISYQGAVIRMPDGSLVREWAMSADAARLAVSLSRQLDLHVNLYKDDNFYVEKMSSAARRYADVARVEPLLVDDLMTVAEHGSTKVVFVDTPERLRELEGRVRAAFEPASRVTFSMPDFLEVVDGDVSKAAALHFVCERHGIAEQEVIAAGDGPNDRELFEYSGLAVAPTDAIAEVLEAADATMPPPGEDGIAYLVEKYLS
ncbi:MAG: Cof-type HAD-IIB family hydrolase [Candidatus Dormibacteria bacterium]